MTKLTNVREKLANARKLCPGMSNDFYILTDYMAANSNDELVPMGIVILSVCVRNDLERGRNGFGRSFPKELANRRTFVKDEIQWIPQLIDAISDEEFAEELRQEWKKAFKVVPPRRVNTKAVNTDFKYPEYVNAAIDWWANAIISPKFDNGEELPDFLSFLMAGFAKEYTAEEIKTFKEALAKGIMDEMSKFGTCTLSVDYHPCMILADAGNLIGVNDLTGYPCKTSMSISEKEVCVWAGYAANGEIIWKA